MTLALQHLHGGKGSPFDRGTIRSFGGTEHLSFRIRFRKVDACLKKLNEPLCGANSPV